MHIFFWNSRHCLIANIVKDIKRNLYIWFENRFHKVYNKEIKIVPEQFVSGCYAYCIHCATGKKYQWHFKQFLKHCPHSIPSTNIINFLNIVLSSSEQKIFTLTFCNKTLFITMNIHYFRLTKYVHRSTQNIHMNLRKWFLYHVPDVYFFCKNLVFENMWEEKHLSKYFSQIWKNFFWF